MLLLLFAAMISTPIQAGITVADSCAISAPQNPGVAPVLQCAEPVQNPLVILTESNPGGTYIAIVNF